MRDRIEAVLVRLRSSDRVRAAWCRAHQGILSLLGAWAWRPAWSARAAVAAWSGSELITLVVHNAYGMGGTIRSAITQANELAAQGRAVRLVSVTRGHDQAVPFFPVDPRVELRLLDDPSADGSLTGVQRKLRGALRHVPSLLVHPDESRFSVMSLWQDLLLVGALREPRGGTVVGTRAALNVAIAHACRPTVVRVGQEHVPLESYPHRLLAALARSYPRLDGLLVLTQAEAAQARSLLGDARTHLAVVPNAVPDTPYDIADGSSQVLVTAGRFSRQKRHDVLLDAFAQLADEFPDWELRFYGRGPREWRVRKQLTRLGLEERVRLMGASERLGEDLAECSIFVLSSEQEAFGIVLLEAMRSQLAVVSTACPHGPPEIVTDGVDGLLVAVNDPDALAAGMRRLMADEALRRRLGARAGETSRAYAPREIARRTAAAYEAAAVVRAAALGTHRGRPGSSLRTPDGPRAR
jgi:glycosyltransferase involved in cell wall biosynthesis